MVTCSWLDAWSRRRPEADTMVTCTCCVETPAMVATLDCTALMKDVLTVPVLKVRVKTTDAVYVESVLDPDGSVLVPDCWEPVLLGVELHAV